MAESTADFHIHSADDPRDSLSKSMEMLVDAAAQLNFRVLAMGRHEQGSNSGLPDTPRVLHPVFFIGKKVQLVCCPAVRGEGLEPAHVPRGRLQSFGKAVPYESHGALSTRGNGTGSIFPAYIKEGGNRRFQREKPAAIGSIP